MGYYENPPIIRSGGGNDAASYIMQAGNSISQALIGIGERRRAEEKQQRLSLEKLQQRKNKLDLYYNGKLSDWKSKQTEVNGEADKQIQDIIQQDIVTAADHRLLLENESDPKKRAEYLKSIRNADVLLENSSVFAKNLTGQVATYRLKTPANKLGEPGGYVVNGANEKEILDNTSALEVLGGNAANVKDSKISVKKNSNGDGLLLTVSGYHKDTNEYFEVPIDSNQFNKSDEESNNGLLIPVETNNAFIENAKKTYFDEKGSNILPGFLEETRETFDLDSKGSSDGKTQDIYQIRNGQRIQIDAIKKGVEDKAEIAANGLLATYATKPAKMRAFIDYTLKKGTCTYDNEFAGKDPKEQLSILKQWMTEDAMNSMTKNLEKTTTKDGVIYWNPSPDISKKEKPDESSRSGRSSDQDKETYTPYQSEYYDKIMAGSGAGRNPKYKPGQVDFRDRRNLVENVNNLSGETDKYITKEDLFEMYKKQPYKSGKYDTGLTIEEAYKKGELKTNPSTLFKQSFGDGKVYMKKGEGAYKPVKGYNFSKAEDRVKFALDQTAGEGEKKQLGGKVQEARMKDLKNWTEKNPRGADESLEAYKLRYEKSN